MFEDGQNQGQKILVLGEVVKKKALSKMLKEIESRPSRILLIDRPAHAQNIVSALRAAGYDCEIGRRVEERRRISDLEYDALVWNWYASRGSPQERVEEIRKESNVPIVFILPSPYADGGGLGDVQGARVVYRPFKDEDLVETVDNVARLHRARKLVSGRKIRTRQPATRRIKGRGATGPRGPSTERRMPLAEDTFSDFPLSARERELTRALARGQRFTDIADEFSISPHTVRNHFKAIFRKSASTLKSNSWQKCVRPKLLAATIRPKLKQLRPFRIKSSMPQVGSPRRRPS